MLFKRVLGLSLVEILIVVAIMAIALGIALPNFSRNKILANEAAAKATVRMISDALELYAFKYDGAFPASESQLLNATPPYLDRPYDDQHVRGYAYIYLFEEGGYTIVTTPSKPGKTGNKFFIISTGGVLTHN